MGKLYYGVLAVVVMAMSLFMGHVAVAVYAQGTTTTPDAQGSLVGLIVVVSGLVTASSTIIVAVINRSGYKKGDNAMVDKVLNTAEGLKGSDEEILQIRDDLATVISVVSNISPEVKTELDRRGASIEAARQKAESLRQELERLYPVVGVSGK